MWESGSSRWINIIFEAMGRKNFHSYSKKFEDEKFDTLVDLKDLTVPGLRDLFFNPETKEHGIPMGVAMALVRYVGEDLEAAMKGKKEEI